MRRGRYVKGKKVGKGNLVNDVSPPPTNPGTGPKMPRLCSHVQPQCGPFPGTVSATDFLKAPTALVTALRPSA